MYIYIYIYIYIHIFYVSLTRNTTPYSASQKSPLCCSGFPIANRPTGSQNVGRAFSLPNHTRLQTLRP